MVDPKAAEQAKVTYSGDPEFKPIEGTSMQYATNTADKVIKVGDVYYLCLQGVWFMSPSATGPWTTANFGSKGDLHDSAQLARLQRHLCYPIHHSRRDHSVELHRGILGNFHRWRRRWSDPCQWHRLLLSTLLWLSSWWIPHLSSVRVLPTV